jgi:hypothetical protein
MISNIELFNGVAGKIFAILYQSFPVKTEIDFYSLMEDFIDPDDYDGTCNVHAYRLRWSVS